MYVEPNHMCKSLVQSQDIEQLRSLGYSIFTAYTFPLKKRTVIQLCKLTISPRFFYFWCQNNKAPIQTETSKCPDFLYWISDSSHS